MPYIAKENRDKLLNHMWPQTAGELNYCFTILIRRYWNKSRENYQALNDIVGALEGAKLELYRRLAVPYENDKIKVNGDVYEGEVE